MLARTNTFVGEIASLQKPVSLFKKKVHVLKFPWNKSSFEYSESSVSFHF